jgi:hypothetical protein
MALAQSRRMTRPPLGRVTPCAGECRAPALAAQSLLQSTDEHLADLGIVVMGRQHRAFLQAVHGASFAAAALARRWAAGVPEPGRALPGTAALALSRLMPGR